MIEFIPTEVCSWVVVLINSEPGILASELIVSPTILCCLSLEKFYKKLYIFLFVFKYFTITFVPF